MQSTRLLGISLALLVASACGCAGPGPDTFPPAAADVQRQADGWTFHLWDTDGDGAIDYRERIDPAGRLAVIDYDLDGDGAFELAVDVPAAAEGARHIVFILDSVPWEVVHDLQSHGRLAMFHPASHTIAPFPVMTDLSLNECFGTGPAPGVESEYFNGERLLSGYEVYFAEANAPWTPLIDYFLDFGDHWALYSWPHGWHNRELRDIQRAWLRSDKQTFVAYQAGNSALGAKWADEGHAIGLRRLERFSQWLIHRTRGRIQITAFSDHGHNDILSRRVDLTTALKELDWNVSTRLIGPRDVVVPEFGPTTQASLSTLSPAGVARDVVTIDGVDQAVYREGDELVVLSEGGIARIAASDDGRRFRYTPVHGDPLDQAAVWDRLKRRGLVDDKGFATDATLLVATADAAYPDAVARLWRAFHGLLTHTPDVFVTTKEGYHCGSEFLSGMLDLRGAHGSLSQRSTYGMVLSTAGQLPPYIRMEDLRSELTRIGVVLPGVESIKK